MSAVEAKAVIGRLDPLEQLLGESVFFVPCEWGTKKPLVPTSATRHSTLNRAIQSSMVRADSRRVATRVCRCRRQRFGLCRGAVPIPSAQYPTRASQNSKPTFCIANQAAGRCMRFFPSFLAVYFSCCYSTVIEKVSRAKRQRKVNYEISHS